ncbi:MAG: hypothetical protein CMN00_04805 [Rickettsiales bacterium]|jgi:hypothetical protein|nr:hypothetical protein [Rickettsiales bacterium]|tara:strand:+ start:124 stop:414 length:291 start_codon:yes stop_codon:yes gene_type:complete
MFHLVYWGDLDHNTFSSDPYNPEWVLFAVWEDKPTNSSKMYFVADPILVYDLANKNKDAQIGQANTGKKWTGQEILNMISHYVPANRNYAIGLRLA